MTKIRIFILIGIIAIITTGRSVYNSPSLCLTNDTVLKAALFKGVAGETVQYWKLPRNRKNSVSEKPSYGHNSFGLSYLHSITLTPVISQYTIKYKDIIHTKEYFTTHGYGLPSFKNDVGVLSWKTENGRFVLEMNRKIHPLVVRISKEYLSTLHIGDKDISLQKYDGKALHFSVHCNKSM